MKAEASSASVMLSTDDLSTVIAEWVARMAGVPLPVAHMVQWAWSPGKGPVATVKVEAVAAVESIEKARQARRG